MCPKRGKHPLSPNILIVTSANSEAGIFDGMWVCSDVICDMNAKRNTQTLEQLSRSHPS